MELITLAAATWYISYAVVNTDGPFHAFSKLRNFKGGRWHGRSIKQGIVDTRINSFGGTDIKTGDIVQNDGLLDCIICLSVWVAFALCMLRGHNDLIDAAAVAGLALWIHAWSGWRYNV